MTRSMMIAVDGIDGRHRGKRGEGKEPPWVCTRFSLGAWRMSRLALDGVAEPVSRGHFLRRERGQREKYFPRSAKQNQAWQHTRLVPSLLGAVTYMHTYAQYRQTKRVEYVRLLYTEVYCRSVTYLVPDTVHYTINTLRYARVQYLTQIYGTWIVLFSWCKRGDTLSSGMR